MLIQDFKYIQFIKFEKTDFNFENNYFNSLKFSYKNKIYTFIIFKPAIDKKIIIEDRGAMLTEAVKNKVLKHKDFYFCFLSEQQDLGTTEFNLNTIFTSYKLGILSNV